MKLLNTISILFLSIFLFVGCQNLAKKQYTIGVSQCSDDLWRETMNKEIQREISFYPKVEVVFKTSKDDTQKQLQDIEEFIEQKVDLLIIAPNESKAFTPLVQKAYEQGIPVILVDRRIDSDHYTAYIGADNYQIGKEAGIYAASLLSGKSKIVEIRGLKGATPDTQRHLGFSEIISQHTDIEIVEQIQGNFLKEEAQRQMVEVFKNHKNIDLIFAMNDQMALGAYEASLQFSGKRPFIIGVDALQGEGVEQILKGVQDASFLYPTGGDKVVELAMKILENQPFEKENTLHTAVVDKQNVRILQLQTEQISEKQAKIEAVNHSLNESLIKYTNQQTLFYVFLIAIILITILLVVAIRAYRNKSKAHRELALKNEKIQRQTSILQQQKEKLERISNQLEEATQDKLLFFTNISHEFKTPLSLIYGPVESLLNEKNLTIEQREMLHLIQRNSQRLLHLISQVIEFRSYENGKLPMNFTKNDIKSFLEEINSLFSGWIKQKNIDFRFISEENSLEMAFDTEKLEKIYINLLSNAFKFVNFGGKIEIRLQKKQNQASLLVFNTGSFIPAEKLNDVFERFYKIDSSSEGTGIGLALTKSLVLAHSGKISVQSTENEGTTFEIQLPLQQEITENPYKISQENHHLKLFAQPINEDNSVLKMNVLSVENQSDKPLILIVEDNADMQKFIQFVLINEFDLVYANNGEEGFEKAKKYIPDLIISDVMMPKKDGFSLCKDLKNNELTNHIPVILLTAYSLDEQKEIGFESGADAYIGKPFNANLLQVRVRKLIENRQKMQEKLSKKLFEPAVKKETIGKAQEKFITDLRLYVQKHLANPDLNVDDLAGTMGLSRSQLYRKIKLLTGYAPNELIRLIRVEYGKQLLMQNTQNISEIAYQIGFSSPSYFAKCFKDLYGESPTEFVEKFK